MSLWGRVFAAGYDRVMAGTEKAGLAARRRALLAGVRGHVLEIGGGTGANLEHYPAAVEELVVTEPEEPMARRLERKADGAAMNVRVVRAPAEALPFDDDSFDFAVSTLVLCTVPDQARALAEIRRVLKPGGRLVFIEHVRAADGERLARWQDRLNPLQQRIGCGCNCNRDTLAAIQTAGFAPDDVEHGRLEKAPPFVRPLIAGTAQRT
jgi:ubiquinone/menaquinone biosynthesis C-methylase UbiE